MAGFHAVWRDLSFRRVILANLGALALAGCVAVPAAHEQRSANGAVEVEPITAPLDAQYALEPGTSYEREIPAHANAEPEYPPALLARRLPPAEVSVALVIDAQGRVEHAEIIEPAPWPEMNEAVLDAVRRWRYVPLRRIRNGTTENLAFSLDFRFRFRQIEGRAVVDRAPATQ